MWGNEIVIRRWYDVVKCSCAAECPIVMLYLSFLPLPIVLYWFFTTAAPFPFCSSFLLLMCLPSTSYSWWRFCSQHLVCFVATTYAVALGILFFLFVLVCFYMSHALSRLLLFLSLFLSLDLNLLLSSLCCLHLKSLCHLYIINEL